MNRVTIRVKLLLSYLLLGTIPVIVLGYISYISTSNAIFSLIEEKLVAQTESYKKELSTTMKTWEEQNKHAKDVAKRIIGQQAALISNRINRSNEKDISSIKSDLFEMKVGKTGYAFALDFKGSYVVAPTKNAVGKNIIEVKDESGKFVIKDMIKITRDLKQGEVGYISYFWKNKGEAYAREKIAALLYWKKMNLVVGISAYYDDLVSLKEREQTIADFKEKILKQKVGDTGYMFVLNSKADAVIHPTIEGQNIYKFDFAKEMTKKKSGYSMYEWKGKMKVAAYSYYKEFDWIIGSSSYLSDFTGPLVKIRNVILTVMIAAIVFALFAGVILSSDIMRSIKHMVNTLGLVADKIKNGELNYRADNKKTVVDFKKVIESLNTVLDTVSGPIFESMKIMKSMAQKDFTQSMTSDYKGIFEEFKNNCNEVNTNLSSALSQIQTSTTEVSLGAKQIADSSQAIAAGASEQAASIEELSSTMSEMNSQTKRNTESVNEIATLSNNTKKDAANGTAQLNTMNKAITDIQTSSESIAKIIKIIEEISFQTNLLALNASVEAARAGVHGKGFSVVAGEVGNLAKRSAEASREITDVITESKEKVNTGVSIASQTAGTFTQIVENIDKISQLAASVSSLSNEQMRHMENTTEAINDMNSVVQQNSAQAEELSASSEELSSQSEIMKSLANDFTVKRAETNLSSWYQEEVSIQSTEYALS